MYLIFAYKCIIEFKGNRIFLSTLIYLAFFAKFFIHDFLVKSTVVYAINTGGNRKINLYKKENRFFESLEFHFLDSLLQK